MPQLVQTIRCLKVGTATASGQRSARSTAWDAELAHVGERHRFDRLIELGHIGYLARQRLNRGLADPASAA
jgi:hypothetical protein